MNTMTHFSSLSIRTYFAVIMSLAFASLTEASTVIPAPAQSHPIVLAGGTVHTVSGATLADTDVVFDQGRIVQIGRRLKAPAKAEVIDVSGKHVYPGLINALTTLGLAETSDVRATLDVAEVGAVKPSVRAQIAINPDSELIPVARINGVLTALTAPTAEASLISGLSAVIRLDGWTWEDLTIRPIAALHVSWPNMTLNHGPHAAKTLDDQQKEIDAQLRKLNEAFAAARTYARAKSAAAQTGQPAPDTDLGWEAMVPVFANSLPVFVHANEAKQIDAALRWAHQQKLKITIVGGADAARFAAELHAADVAVILAGTQKLPWRRDDDFDQPFNTPEKLRVAGVRFCIASVDAGLQFIGNERNVGYEAAKAVGYGLPREEAIKSVTLYAAQLIGVGDELGSIETGKRATLIVTDGDPLEIATHVEIAFIDGARIELRDRQTALYDKYRERLRRIDQHPSALPK